MGRGGLVGALVLTGAIGVAAPARAAAPATRFASKVNPYSIAYPAAWRHVSGHLSGSFRLFSYDEFYDPQRSYGFNVNVVVARLLLAAPMTTLDYLRQSEQTLRGQGDSVREAGTAMLAGRRETLLAITDTRAQVQAYLVLGKQVWVFSLTTAIGDSNRWLSTFTSMLRSVQLR